MPTQVHPYDLIQPPDLRILPLKLLVEHEFNDIQRTAPLAQRLEAEGILKNPPIVAPIGDGDPRFMVLDGANRTMALSGLGYPHVLAQVVKYEEPVVTLTTWHHLVSEMDQEEFIQALSEAEGIDLFPIDYLHARAALARRECLMYIMGADGKVYVARPKLPGLFVHEQNQLLNALVDTYKERGKLHRAMTDSLEEAQRLYPDLTGVVVFPKYDPFEVLALARDGELLPTGLTRHLIQGRILRVNYPLSELKSGEALEAKNARLQEWLRHKMTSREVRFYGEMTYLFDE
jgi:L-serine kinase (ATP) / ParB family transcriptional regulator, heme-responsive regulator